MIRLELKFGTNSAIIFSGEACEILEILRTQTVQELGKTLIQTLGTHSDQIFSTLSHLGESKAAESKSKEDTVSPDVLKAVAEDMEKHA